jgi:integrase
LATVRAAVAAGIDLNDLGSLHELLKPDRVKVIIDHYWVKNGDIPRTYTIDLAWRLVSIARNLPGYGQEDLEELTDIWQALEPHRPKGLTGKNRTVVRQVLHSDIWSKVIQLPGVLMARARSGALSQQHSVLAAQLSVAIAILILAPVRMKNLATIRLGINLVRPGGPGTPYLLTFQDYEVKNRVPLAFPLLASVSQLIDEYVFTYRPLLMNGHNHDYLFPGKSGGHKFVARLSSQISKLLWKWAGFRITPHQFRHAAAALILKNHPGNYELVRRVLGHRKIQTTIDFYVGLETAAAALQFGEIVAQLSARAPTKADR